VQEAFESVRKDSPDMGARVDEALSALKNGFV